MRTKDEVIKMFRKQEGKSAEQIINWYKAELKEDVNARLKTIHDWEAAFFVNYQIDKSGFSIKARLHQCHPNTCTVHLFKRINDHEILNISIDARL